MDVKYVSTSIASVNSRVWLWGNSNHGLQMAFNWVNGGLT